MNITVYLGATEGNDPALITAVKALGTWIGSNGHSLVYGGSRCGLMGMLAQSVLESGGHVTGVEPRFFVEAGFVYDAIDELIVTETMRERKAVMEDKADAFVICPGGIGTLEEFFEVITLKQLGRHQKPIVILNTLQFYDPMLDMMEQSVANDFMADAVHKLYTVAYSLDEVWEQLENYQPFTYDKYDI